MLRYFPSISSLLELLSWNGVGSCRGLFCIYWDDHVAFVFASINVLYYIHWFSYIESPLHFWDKANLVVVNDLSDLLLNSSCHYFIEDFCINVHEGDWPIILLFGGVFSWFGDECNIGFIKWVRQCSFSFYFVEEFKENCYSFFLKVWQNSAENPLGLELFFFGRLFIAASISFCVIDLFRWLMSF
jgi:hypothetical protein